MNTALRRLRGMFGMAAIFSILWIVVGTTIWTILAYFFPGDIAPDEGPRRFLPIFALLGFLCGLGFSTIVMLTERNNSIDKLSTLRMALWGAIGSALIPILMGANPNMWLLTAPMGALFASASVAIARRGQLPAPADTQQIEAP
jgi:hypothetical protein